MITCYKCKSTNSDDRIFCKNCGERLKNSPSFYNNDVNQKSVLEDKLKNDPDDIALLIEYGQCLFDNLLYNDAITILLKITTLGKENSLVNDLLYRSFKKIEKFQDALLIGEKLLVSMPEDIFLINDLIETAISAGNDKEALLYIDTLLRFEPDNKNVWSLKALLLSKTANEKEVISAWNKVYNLDPHNKLAKMYKGIEACNSHDFKKSITLLESLINEIESQHDKNIALFYYVYSLFKINNEDPALMPLIKSIDFNAFMDSSNSFVRNMLEDLFIFQGDNNLVQKNYTLAIDNFTEAFKINKNEKCKESLANSFFKQASFHFENNELSLAEKNILDAIDLIPDNPEYKTLKGKINSKTKIGKRRKKYLILFALSSILLICGIVLYVQIFSPYLDQKAEWTKVKKENTYESYMAFINKQGAGGRYSDEAYEMIYKLDSIKQLKQDTYRKFITNYYESLSNKCYDAFKYFTSHVDLFITMKNTTPEKINNYIKGSFYKEYLQVKYFIEPNGYKAEKMSTGETKISFIEKMTCFRNSKQKYQLVRTETEIIFNIDNKIRFWNSAKVLENSFTSKADAITEIPSNKNNNPSTLTINGTKVNIRFNPTKQANVIMQLNTGDICEIIAKGNLENINGNSDYWYEVKFNGKTGWVFGTFTSLKQAISTTNNSSFYILNVAAVNTIVQAKKQVEQLKKQGNNSDYLWIPDYASLSGAKLFSVYIGPFSSQYECEVATENYRKKHPEAYGLFVSQERKRVQINGIGKVIITNQ